MGNITGAGGTTTSFSKTPQANGDAYSFIENELLVDDRYNDVTNTITLDVMSNDLGGASKSLFSIDDAEGNAIQDLSQSDLLTNSKNSAWQRTEDDNWIRIYNGKIEYRLADPADPNNPEAAREVNSLTANDVIDDHFTYAIKLGNGTLSWATVSVRFQGQNDDATITGTSTGALEEAGLDASGAAFAGTPGASGTLAVSDADMGESSFQIATPLAGTYGNFTFNTASGAWTYTLENSDPDTQALAVGEVRHDTLTVTSFDGTASQVIDITITGTNDAPTISVDTSGGDSAAATISETDTALSAGGTLTVIDPDTTDSVGLSVTGVTTGGTFGGTTPSAAALLAMISVTNSVAGDSGASAKATWSFNSGGETFDFLPAGATLVLNYTISAEDGHGGIDTQLISVTITGANDAPVATASNAVTTDEDTASLATAIGATDVDGDTLSYATKVGAGPANGSVAYDQVAGTFVYTPNPDFNGSDSFTIVISDGNGGTVEQAVTVTVNAANDAPVATASNAVTTDEDTASLATAIGATDVDGDTLSYATKVGAGPANGSVAYDQVAGTFVYTPNPDFNGSDSFTIVISDGNGGTVEQAVTVTVNAVNDAPVATASNAVTTDEDTASLATAIGATDVDGDTLSYATKVGAGPANGSVAYDQVAGTFVYTPNPDFNGSDSFTIVISDGNGGTVEQAVTVTVNAVNDAPVATASNAVTTDEDTASLATAIGATDVDGDTLSYATKVGAGPANGSVAYDQVAGTFVYTPNPDFNGSDSFTIVISDGNGGTVEQAVNVTVNAVNDAALVSGDTTGSMVEDAIPNTVSGDLNASDVDNPADNWLPSSGTGANGYGTFTINAAGQWVYTLNNTIPAVNALNNGQTLADSFSVATIDGTIQVVNVTINGHTDVTAVTAPTAYTGPNADPNDFDTLSGGTANASTNINGGNSTNDTITGGSTDQNIDGKGGNDTIYGGAGSDSITGNEGDDTLYGQVGNDSLAGNNGLDAIFGGSGNDTLTGGNDADTLYGGSGSDLMTGQGGDDIIIGGYGADTLTGGNGSDTFTMLSLLDTNDLITDFASGSDVIDLSALDANAAVDGNQDFAWGGTSATANGVWYAQNGADTVVYADADGNAATAEFMITLQNYDSAAAPLQHADFIGAI